MQMQSLAEFQEFAAKFAREIKPRAASATVITLSGELGAGKTTFVQTVAKMLGVEENITSPTFVIEKIYLLKGQAFTRLVHVDAYRLEDAEELQKLGFSELLSDPGTLLLLEWPEKVASLIPDTAVKIRFDIADQKRTISSNGTEEAGRKQ